MSECELKPKIFSKAFELFAERGFNQVEFENIASDLKVDVSSLRSLFSSKEELIVETGRWKMESIGKQVGAVVDLEIPILEKLIKYTEVMYQCLSSASYKVAVGMFIWQEDLSQVMNTYLKQAVYDRFSKMIEEAASADLLDAETDVAEALFKYWEMLSSILAVSVSNKIPLELNPDKKVSDFVCGEMIKVYFEVLNNDAKTQLKQQLVHHPFLSKLSA